MENTSDVVVVGAGPAGLVAAQITAAAGLKTVVFEKNESIGIPVRSSGGSWISDLTKLGIPPEYYHPLHELIVVIGKEAACYPYPEPAACVLDVRRLFQYLGEQAVKAGAVIRLKTNVESPLMQGGVISGVVSKNGKNGSEVTTRANIVIDSSGYGGLVGKRSGLNSGYKSFGFGAEYDLYAPAYDEHTAYLLMGSVASPNGYGWAFPYGNHRVRLGVGVIRPFTEADPREYLDRMFDATTELSQSLRGASPIEYHTGLFPVYPPSGRKFVQDGLLLVGDAGGQGSSLAGEGIRYAIASAKMAGRVVLDAFQNQDFSSRFLKTYEYRWKAEFEKDLSIAYWVFKQISRFSDQNWDDLMPFLRRLTPYQIAMGLRCDFNLDWLSSVAIHNPTAIIKIIRRIGI